VGGFCGAAHRGFPVRGQANAWAALGFEPWVVLVASLVGASTLLPADLVPEDLRQGSPSRLTWGALVLAVLAGGVAVAAALAPPDAFGNASEVGLGSLVALWASCLMTLGVWLSRKGAQ
jgi:hypothetical protein